MPIDDARNIPEQVGRGTKDAEIAKWHGLHATLCHAMHAPSHADLPPSLLVTCGYDMLRDVEHQYARKLAAAGNEITYFHYPDLPHGITQMTTHSQACLRATEEIARLLGRAQAAR